MKNISFLLLLSIIIISCSRSPLDKVYKHDTLEEDIVALKESISEEELNTLEGYIALKSSFDKDELLGKTYNDLLNEAKKMFHLFERRRIEKKLEKLNETNKRISEKRIKEYERFKEQRKKLLKQ